jgi:hypothetical protein
MMVRYLYDPAENLELGKLDSVQIVFSVQGGLLTPWNLKFSLLDRGIMVIV